MKPGAGRLCLALAATFWAAPARAVDLDNPEGVLDLAGQWLFHPGDSAAFASPHLDDRDWAPHRLPTRWARWKQRWAGYGWYRLHLDVDARATATGLLLSLGPAREAVEIYVNGSLIAQRGRLGSRPYGGARVVHLAGPVPAGLLKTGDNVVAVRVFDPSFDGGVPSGPLILGPADPVLAQTERQGQVALAARAGLALLALWLGLTHLFTGIGRRASRENLWLIGAGLGLAAYTAQGIGVFERFVPNLELATRLPLFGGAVAILGLGRFFAGRYDDWGARHVRVGTLVLGVLAAVQLLAWQKLVYLAGEAVLLVVSLVIALYVARLLSDAARRFERGALPIFFGVIGVAVLLIYDGMTASAVSLLPPWSAIGAVGVLLITTAAGAAGAAKEHEGILIDFLKLKRRMEATSFVGILDGTAMSITAPPDFLTAVVHEMARELEVRRCSLAVAGGDSVLTLCAAMGLPKAALGERIEPGSGLAGWVFVHGQPITSASLPRELAAKRRGSGYQSEAFICYPVQRGDVTLGVLNVSDRNDGGSFTAEDEVAVAEVANKLALVLTRLAQGPDVVRHAPLSAPASEINAEIEASIDAAVDSFGSQDDE